jgi:hypothetical protein
MKTLIATTALALAKGTHCPERRVSAAEALMKKSGCFATR